MLKTLLKERFYLNRSGTFSFAYLEFCGTGNFVSYRINNLPPIEHEYE